MKSGFAIGVHNFQSMSGLRPMRREVVIEKKERPVFNYSPRENLLMHKSKGYLLTHLDSIEPKHSMEGHNLKREMVELILKIEETLTNDTQ